MKIKMTRIRNPVVGTGTVQEGWNPVVGTVQEGWNPVVGTVQEGWNPVVGTVQEVWKGCCRRLQPLCNLIQASYRQGYKFKGVFCYRWWDRGACQATTFLSSTCINAFCFPIVLQSIRLNWKVCIWYKNPLVKFKFFVYLLKSNW